MPAFGRRGLIAGAALSFLTAVAAGAAGMLALFAVAATSAVSSGLGSYGSSSRVTGTVVVFLLISLGLAFVLFWGGLEAALGRGVILAIAGNVVAIVLVIIVAVQSSGSLLIVGIVPALAAILVALSRSALGPPGS